MTFETLMQQHAVRMTAVARAKVGKPYALDISLGNDICILTTSKKLAEQMSKNLPRGFLTHWRTRLTGIRKLTPRRGTVGWGYRYAVEGKWERKP